MAQLKVFRTPIGFHDAYVAAPSQKAALAAWGADADLFARGAAERVTDAALIAAPLATPGKVVRVLRGSDSDHFEALAKSARPKNPPRKRSPAKIEQPAPAPRKAPVRSPPRKPRPSRTPLDRAEKAVEVAQRAQTAALAEIAEREQALREEKRALKLTGQKRIDTLEARRDATRAAYQQALANWAAT